MSTISLPFIKSTLFYLHLCYFLTIFNRQRNLSGNHFFMAKRKKSSFIQFIEGVENRFHTWFQNLTSHDISVADILFFLQDTNIMMSDTNKLAHVEAAIVKALAQTFEDVEHKYKVNEELGIKVNIRVGHGVGIICCLAKNLTSTKIINLMGRMAYLSQKTYPDSLLLLIVGSSIYKNSELVEELEDIAEKLGTTFYYMSVQ